ncbi:MAG: hypothetical protein HQL91_12765 [Magnetococcales bacterium]|nr:hypothetical protein [Magnetococcales bacterium]
MNFYFLVEGKTEKRIYKSWVESFFCGIQGKMSIDDLDHDSFFIFSTNGYPFQKDLLAKTVQDLQSPKSKVDHLFLCIDADDESVETRAGQIAQRLHDLNYTGQYSIIVANRCLETWLLGNRNIKKMKCPNEYTPSNPTDESSEFPSLRNHFDVHISDPESMPVPDGCNKTISKFHKHYLKELFRYYRFRYSEKDPGITEDPDYLNALIERHQETGHLASFGHLLHVWNHLTP